MIHHFRFPFLVLAVLPHATSGQVRPDSANARGPHEAVAAGRSVSVEAGLAILRQGGNAVDAAVATLLVQSVTESTLFCFGGEVPIMVYDAKRDVLEVLSGQGVAPQLASLDYFQTHKNGKIPRNRDPAGAAVPAALHACLTALDRYGTMSFAQVARPMLRTLDRDEPQWSPQLAANILRMIGAEKEAAGDRSKGIGRARDFFYSGPIAREFDQWSRENGGLIRDEDLAAHQTHIESPVAISYRGYTVHKCGPWTQGPYMLQTLRLLESFDLKAMGHNSPDYIHVVTEAMKLALADRDTYYADPLFVDVPLQQLLSEPYADVRRELIDMKRASLELIPGDPIQGNARLGVAPSDYKLATSGGSIPTAGAAGGQAKAARDHDTTTCIVADRWGNVVVATPSGWDGALAGKTGVQLGCRLISLNTWPGHPNCVQPGKRPRITLTPTLVTRDGVPVIGISVAGGDLQDQTSLQVLLNIVEFGMNPSEAVTAPRFKTEHLIGSFGQPKPKLGSLSLYKGFSSSKISELESRGHLIRLEDAPFGAPIALVLDPKTGIKHVAGDPAAKRHVAAE